MRWLILFYILILIILALYTYGFVDPNLVLSTSNLYKKFHQPLFELVFNNRPLSTTIFIVVIFLFSIFYFLSIRLAVKKKLNLGQLKRLLGITVGILILSYPAFSYDIFNYIFTAKVSYYYHENPYLVMPIEFIGDPNIAFTRAANKLALYGPSWIIISLIPFLAGLNNLILTIFSFKALVAVFYLATTWMIWKLSKNMLSVVIFALNPLIVIETLVSGHNDIVMMFFALLSYLLLKERKIGFAVISLGISILVKYATIVLLPIFLYAALKTIRKEKVDWDKVYLMSWLVMFIVFLVSPLREEIYPWYVIWFLSFAVFMRQVNILLVTTIVLSITTILRYPPVLYTGEYTGITPVAKEVLTFVPIIVVIAVFVMKKLIAKRYAP